MLMTKRAEKKKLEIKWEAVKGLRNEYKSKARANNWERKKLFCNQKDFSSLQFVCLICDKRKRALVILPCAHFVLCGECFTEGEKRRKEGREKKKKKGSSAVSLGRNGVS